jgi:hypothetical protein
MDDDQSMSSGSDMSNPGVSMFTEKHARDALSELRQPTQGKLHFHIRANHARVVANQAKRMLGMRRSAR